MSLVIKLLFSLFFMDNYLLRVHLNKQYDDFIIIKIPLMVDRRSYNVNRL